MHEGIAYCGLDCGNCPALLATRRTDMEALAGVAERWSAETGTTIIADSILCDGCKSSTGRINKFCAVCAIKDCAAGRGLATCADCEEYACKTLRAFPPFEVEGKSNLERVREGAMPGRDD